MIIDINELINNSKEFIEINKNIEVDNELLKKTDIIRLENTIVKGKLKKISDNIYNINLIINGNMILPCSISLEEVKYPFKSNIDFNLDIYENEYNIKNINNTLDIFPILWENIVLEIPTRIVKEGVKPEIKGDGWCLTDEYVEEKNQLSDLKKLLDKEM